MKDFQKYLLITIYLKKSIRIYTFVLSEITVYTRAFAGLVYKLILYSYLEVDLLYKSTYNLWYWNHKFIKWIEFNVAPSFPAKIMELGHVEDVRFDFLFSSK